VASQPVLVPGGSALPARDADRLRSTFLEQFPASGTGLDAIRVVRAPGRVNLIGEHTDYNQGLVLPVAIDLGIAIAMQPRPDRRVELLIASTGERTAVDLDAGMVHGEGGRPRWSDYLAGMAAALVDAGGEAHGFDGLLASDLPIGAGLSSSAALDVAFGWALAGGAPPLPDPMAVARAAQHAENDYVGVPCGLMDPFAVVFGVAGSAVLLDCRSLEHRPVSIPPGAALVIADSGIRRDLRTSRYGDRRAECGAAAAALGRLDPAVRSLRDATLDALDAARSALGETGYRRARHVVTENGRVLATVAAFEAGDVDAAGRLLLESHTSLRDDFEVSLPALDRLVDLAAGVPGVYGSRMTGGGFGGATISLVREDAVGPLTAELEARYRTPAGEPPVVRRVIPSGGAGIVAIGERLA
jgi:galactokinase